MLLRCLPLLAVLLPAIALPGPAATAAGPGVVYQGGEGPGQGKHIVFLSGDEEYRSEEGLPQLAKILSTRHGFTCTVLFAVNPSDGTIDPNTTDNIPGIEALDQADLVVMLLRFRNLPDVQMKHVDDYLKRGGPIVALRTSTHAFNFKADSPYARYSWSNKGEIWQGGFGRQILGETWINHHGDHGKESTRGILAPDQKDSPILRGIVDGDIWGPTDVYGVRLPLPGDSQPLVLGQVLTGMLSSDEPVEGKKNDPMMPVAWTKTYHLEPGGKTGRAFVTTMGASQDLLSEGLRRLIVNACYWAVGLEAEIPARADVRLVGTYVPSPFGFNGFIKGVTPADVANSH